MKLLEFMTTRIQFIDAGATVYDVVEKMVDRRIRSVIVRPVEAGSGHGVITARDVVLRVLAKGLDPAAVRAGELASRPLFCVEKDADLEDALRIMQAEDIARIFVCDQDRIIGVVALLDVMSAVLIRRARGDHADQ